jgi:signal transduction histidine kinase/ActR/RegA family two-component response regulator
VKHRAYLSRTHDLIAGTDWSRTPLGPPEGWPLSLKSYVAMVMAMPTPAIIFWGPELTQIYNDGYAEIMGPRHPRFFGAPYQACWPDTYPLIYPWMRRVLDDAEVVEVERERIPVTRFGFEEDAYFTFTFTPLRDDAGRIAGILQPVFEVTESVLAERRATLLRRLSTVSEGAVLWPHALEILATAEGDIVEAAVCEVGADGGLVPIASTPPAAGAPLVIDERLRADADAALRSGHPSWSEGAETVLLPLQAGASDGPRLLLYARTNPRLHRNRAYIQFLEMVAVELSSALRRSEAATADERQRAFLQRLLLQAPAGIAVLRGPQHVFALTNSMYQAVIGQRDVIGLPIREAMPELQGQRYFQKLDEVYRTGTPYVGLAEPVPLVREPGKAPEEVFFNFVYQPLQDDQQRTDGILVFCYEVTVQVLARQRSEELMQALRLEHRRKDDFLAMLAHELRNPLAPVSSAAQLLTRAPGDAEVVRKASGIIARQVKHLSGLVNDLLDVSRVTRGLVVLDRQPQDLRSVLLDAAEQVRPLTEARSHRLLLELSPESVRVLGDHKRLVQIFTNLLANAAKYTPDGGRISLQLTVEEGHARTRVADDGIGIEAELLPRVFDLFVQGQRGADRGEGGLGIGLALVRSLVEMHGGSVAADSAGADQGSRFEVRLPTLAPSAEADAGPGDAHAPEIGAGHRVLVVDDNVDAAQMLALQLGAMGFAVDVVHRGSDALDACSMQPYLACLLDIGLPDLHGTEVAAGVKSRLGDEAPLLVAVSGYGQEADMRIAREAGFDHYFVKPVDIELLLRALQDRAQRSQAVRPAPGSQPARPSETAGT